MSLKPLGRVAAASAIAIGAGTSSGGAAPAAPNSLRLSTYVLFDGNCRQAMQFYQSILGGDLALSSVGDSPMAKAFPKEMHQRVVNGRLKSPTIELSASDWLAPNDTPSRGNMNALYLDGASPDATRAVFEKLSAGGTVTAPFAEQPFGWYGRLIDAYGVVWMVHAEKR
jgi:PhnB protein